MISKAGAEMKARARARRISSGRAGMAKKKMSAYQKTSSPIIYRGKSSPKGHSMKAKGMGRGMMMGNVKYGYGA